MTYSNQLLGPIAIIFSNFSAVLTLGALRFFGQASHSSVAILGIGNLACGFLLFFQSLTGRPVIPNSKISIFSLCLWAFCYSLNYGLFAIYPDSISLSDIMIAQSLAPTAAVILTGDWLKVKNRNQGLGINIVGICILLGLAHFKNNGTKITESAFSSQIPMLISMLCFLGTNFAARLVTRGGGPLWGQTRVAFLNGVFLIALAYATSRFDYVHLSGDFFKGIIIAVGVLATQVSFLYGLAKTRPFMAALNLSTSVPIAIISDSFLNNHPLNSIQIGLSVLYCLFIWVTNRKQGTEERS